MALAEVQFLPGQAKYEIQRDESILFAAQKAGLTDVECCGMNPLCGKCKVSIVSGLEAFSEIRKKEEEYRDQNGFLPFQRLGCLARLKDETKLELMIEIEQ